MNATNTTNKQWYVLSFLSLTLASMVGVHASLDEEEEFGRDKKLTLNYQSNPKRKKRDMSPNPQRSFEIFMDSNYLMAKYYENKYYEKNGADDKGTVQRERKAVKVHFWEAVLINKEKLSDGIAAAVPTVETVKAAKKDTENENNAMMNEDNPTYVTIEFVRLSDVAKILTGLYNIKDSKKEKRKKRDNVGVNTKQYESLQEAAENGIDPKDYQRVVEVTSMHVALNDDFGYEYHHNRNQTLKNGFDKLMPDHYKSLMANNPGKDRRGKGGKGRKSEKDVIRKTLFKSVDLGLEEEKLVLDSSEKRRLEDNLAIDADAILADRAEKAGDSQVAKVGSAGVVGVTAGAILGSKWKSSKGKTKVKSTKNSRNKKKQKNGE